MAEQFHERSLVGTAQLVWWLVTGQPTIPGSILGRGYGYFSFPARPDWHWMSHSLYLVGTGWLLRQWCGWGVNLTVICNWCRVYVSVQLYLRTILWRRTWFLVCGLIFVGLALTEAVSSLSVTAGHTMWGLWLTKYSGRLGLSPSTWAFHCQYNSTDTPYLSPSLYCL